MASNEESLRGHVLEQEAFKRNAVLPSLVEEMWALIGR